MVIRDLQKPGQLQKVQLDQEEQKLTEWCFKMMKHVNDVLGEGTIQDVQIVELRPHWVILNRYCQHEYESTSR